MKEGVSQILVKFILRHLDIFTKLDFHKDQRGNTPILVAAAEGHENIVKLLIPFYENPRVRGMSGWSALTLAAIRGHLGIVKLLSNDLKRQEDIQDLINSRFKDLRTQTHQQHVGLPARAQPGMVRRIGYRSSLGEEQ